MKKLTIDDFARIEKSKRYKRIVTEPSHLPRAGKKRSDFDMNPKWKQQLGLYYLN